MVDISNIIDAHCHIGTSLVSGVEITEAGLLATMAANRVDGALVMPQPHQGLEVAPVTRHVLEEFARWLELPAAARRDRAIPLYEPARASPRGKLRP